MASIMLTHSGLTMYHSVQATLLTTLLCLQPISALVLPPDIYAHVPAPDVFNDTFAAEPFSLQTSPQGPKHPFVISVAIQPDPPIVPLPVVYATIRSGLDQLPRRTFNSRFSNIHVALPNPSLPQSGQVSLNMDSVPSLILPEGMTNFEAWSSMTQAAFDIDRAARTGRYDAVATVRITIRLYGEIVARGTIM